MEYIVSVTRLLSINAKQENQSDMVQAEMFMHKILFTLCLVTFVDLLSECLLVAQSEVTRDVY